MAKPLVLRINMERCVGLPPLTGSGRVAQFASTVFTVSGNAFSPPQQKAEDQGHQGQAPMQRVGKIAQCRNRLMEKERKKHIFMLCIPIG